MNFIVKVNPVCESENLLSWKVMGKIMLAILNGWRQLKDNQIEEIGEGKYSKMWHRQNKRRQIIICFH